MQAFVGDVEADRTKNGTPHVGAGVPTAPAAHGNDLITPTANPHTPVGRADPGAPRSNAHGFLQLWANSQAPPCREGACPFRQGMPRRPPTLGESATVQRIRPGFSMSASVLRGKGKPFPYNETAADSPGVAACLWRCCGRAGDAGPYNEMLRIRRRWRLVFGAAAEPDTGWTTFPTKRRFPCIDGDGECEEQDLRAFHVRLCGMDVFLTHSQARAVSHESKRTVPVDSFCPFRPKSPSKISPSPSICSCSPGADTV